MLSVALLTQLCLRPTNAAKRAIYDRYIEAFTSPEAATLLAKYGVVNERRVAHFLAQIAHESGGFTLIWESGAYSAQRIMQIFGVGKHSARVTQAEANRLAGNGPALFERVYGLGNPGKAKELGNTQSGDGWRFRGCGPQQITGRWAHERYALKIGCRLEDLEKPINGLHAALLEWTDKSCNPLADSEDGTDRALRAITKRINGGYNGLPDRKAYLKKAQRLIQAVPAKAPAPSPADRAPILEIGDDGRDVRTLQELLVQAGYVIHVDGLMGPRTEAALAGFQKNYGLVVSGRADDATWAMLREVTSSEGVKTPKTREVDEERLEKNSIVWRVLTRIRFWVGGAWRLLFGGTALTASAEASGLDVFEGISSVFDRIASAWTRLDLPTAFSSAKGWIFLGLIGIGIGFWLLDRWAKKGQEAQKDDADLGVNQAV